LIGDIAPNNTFAGQVLEQLIDGGGLYKCNGCNMFFRHPQLNEKELNKLYRLGNLKNWSSNASHRRDWYLIRNWLVLQEGIERILDIGCFDGRFLEYLGKDYCWLGIEIHNEAASSAESKGVELVGRNFENMPVLSPLADLVVAVDVLEHSSDPKSFLKAAASCVRPGGYIVISTGNTDALSWRLMGSKYWYCHIPEHFSFINPTWARYVAPKLDLQIEEFKVFSHSEGKVDFKRKLFETIGNLLLLICPKMFAMIRKFGFGGINYRLYPELALAPPCWVTSMDHMIIVFQRRTN